MSLPLHDLKRIKLSDEGYAFAVAWARRKRCTIQAAVREIVDQVAVTEIHAARVLVSLAPREARVGDAEGQRAAAQEHGPRIPFADLRRSMP
jgi:hypothetical protein